ncbi:hypothetical protein ACQ4PT_030798 [Festuca glaucescens]
MPHLDDGIVSEILYRLPTKEAYRLAAVCPQWRAVLSQPTFLRRHLSPRPLGLRPYALVVQPRRQVGYFTHLTLVAFDPRDPVPVDVPPQAKYRDHAPLPLCLLDTASDDSVFRILYSTGADDDDANPLATATLDVPADRVRPPEPPQMEDYAVFFERTAPMLGISIVAFHGRLLLGCSRSRYYVCDPAANRWLALPPSTIAPASVANCGLHYDASTGLLAFTVVLLVRRTRERVLVETFRSATGRWDAVELAAHGAARCLGAASPGIHIGLCFYWLSLRRGRILRYDMIRGRASVLREPMEATGSKGRVSRSLGSVGGRLRLCTYDARDTENVLGVWLMDGSPVVVRPSWQRVQEVVVREALHYFRFSMPRSPETSVDFPGASSKFIVVDQRRCLFRYNLQTGGKVMFASLLIGNNWRSRPLYSRYHVFPFYMST